MIGEISDCRLSIEIRGRAHIQPALRINSTMDNRHSAIGNSSWWLVTLCVAREAEEFASALLFDLGSTGIVTLAETPDRVTLGAYFEERTLRDDFEQSISGALGRDEFSISISAVPEQDWMQKWKEGFEAVEIGRRLVVAPSWKLPLNSTGRVLIQIDPGMAFGTGTHETTRLCLDAIEHYWHAGNLLDVGTGTGILAIAAALLAPGSRVVAIDIDPQAIDVARENMGINGVSGSIDLREGHLANLDPQEFDVIVANLTAEVIVDLMTDFPGYLASTGRLILSGILSEFAPDVVRALCSCDFTVTERRDAGEWCAFIAARV
jgi:ribosomal protein L11 methyltransferase